MAMLTKNTLDPARLPLLLTVRQYADLAQMSEAAVRAQLRSGSLNGVKVGPKLWRIPRTTALSRLGITE